MELNLRKDLDITLRRVFNSGSNSRFCHVKVKAYREKGKERGIMEGKYPVRPSVCHPFYKRGKELFCRKKVAKKSQTQCMIIAGKEKR